VPNLRDVQRNFTCLQLRADFHQSPHPLDVHGCDDGRIQHDGIGIAGGFHDSIVKRIWSNIQPKASGGSKAL
jgi:hypothetical protein